MQADQPAPEREGKKTRASYKGSTAPANKQACPFVLMTVPAYFSLNGTQLQMKRAHEASTSQKKVAAKAKEVFYQDLVRDPLLILTLSSKVN